MKPKNSFFGLLIGLISAFLVAIPALAEDSGISTGFDAGYRVDNLRWNIAGNIDGASPNILSELTWKDLKIFQTGVHTKINLDSNVFFQGSASFGIITNGKNQDSDYHGDNRTLEFSRSNNSSNGDYVGDISMAVGINTLTGGMFQISPLFGYAYNWQNVRMTNGYQTIDTDNNNIGPIAGLNSTYKTKWQGPWLGVSLKGDFSPAWTVFGNMEYHLVSYSGEGNWNLRDDLDHPVSFEHSADGDGRAYSFGLGFSPTDQSHFTLKYCYSLCSTGDGTDIIYFSNGTYGVTRFHEAVWESKAIIFSYVQSF